MTEEVTEGSGGDRGPWRGVEGHRGVGDGRWVGGRRGVESHRGGTGQSRR
jgi:hypothetical protein